MDRPELLLHVVGREEVKHGSELQKQVVLETEDWSRANEGCFWKDASGNFFTASLHSVTKR